MGSIPMKKKNTRLEKKEIAEIVATLFAKKGFVGTTMRDISKGLNVSIASVYYHFKNKEDILFYIIESIGEELLSFLKKAKYETDDPLDQLYNMLTTHAILTIKKGKWVKVYVEEQHNLSKKSRVSIYRQHREIYDLYSEQIRKLEGCNEIHPGLLPVATFAIFGMINWCYWWYKQDGALTIGQIAEKLTKILFHGIVINHDGNNELTPDVNSLLPKTPFAIF